MKYQLYITIALAIAVALSAPLTGADPGWTACIDTHDGWVCV